MSGRSYLMQQAATLIRLARVTSTSDAAMGLIDKATALHAKAYAIHLPGKAPDAAEPDRPTHRISEAAPVR